MTNTSIGNASGEGVFSPNSQAWNISDLYTKLKIGRILVELDIHETIAMFGRKDMEEIIPNEMIIERRVEALHRMLFCLKQLIGNCKFSIDKKDKFSINNLDERIKNVEDVMDGIAFENINDVTHEVSLRINETHFKVCFNILRGVKDDLNLSLDKANLIFRHSDSVDLDKIMSDIIENG